MKKMKKRTLFIPLIVFLLVLGPGFSLAAAQEPEPQNPVAVYLAAYLGELGEEAYDEYAEIIALQQDGFGLGIIGRAIRFSEVTGMELSVVLDLILSDGWGQMYRDHDVHPGGLGLGSLMRNSEGNGQGNGHGRPEWAGGPGGPPEHAGPPDNAGPNENSHSNGNGPPEHAGPPDHAGPKGNSGNQGPPDNAGPKGNNGIGRP